MYQYLPNINTNTNLSLTRVLAEPITTTDKCIVK